MVLPHGTRSYPLPGVSALSVYVPRLRVPLEAWCEWTASRYQFAQPGTRLRY